MSDNFVQGIRKVFAKQFPFASFEECVQEMSGEVDDPQSFCAWLYMEEEGHHPAEEKNKPTSAQVNVPSPLEIVEEENPDHYDDDEENKTKRYSRAYLETIFSTMKELVPSWLYEEIEAQARPKSGAKAKWENYEKNKFVVELAERFVPSYGNNKATVAFIGASPSSADLKAREPLHDTKNLFTEKYLSPLGLTEGDFFISNIVPVVLYDESGGVRSPSDEELKKWEGFISNEFDRIQPDIIIALGSIAGKALKDRADITIPHPNAVAMYGDSGEVGRKLKALKEQREEENEKVNKSFLVKAIVPEQNHKQIVYGVVLEPNIEDAQGDTIDAEEIEKTAHRYMMASQTIGKGHEKVAQDVDIVESYISPITFTLNGETIHKGSWVMAVKVLNDRLWKDILDRKYKGFSIGAVGRRIEGGEG